MSDPHPPGMTRRELRRRAAALSAAPAADADSAATTDRPVRVLMVCTGNICRSPLAEVLLRERLGSLPVRVRSAGTRALIGESMPRPAQDLAVAYGAPAQDAADHRARWLDEQIAGDADLVLAMAREHRSGVVELVPRMLRKTLTLREFARLSAGLDDERIRSTADAAGQDARRRLDAVTQLVTQQRGLVAPASLEDDDVIDPYRRSVETYELSASQLVPAIDEVARVLRATLR